MLRLQSSILVCFPLHEAGLQMETASLIRRTQKWENLSSSLSSDIEATLSHIMVIYFAFKFSDISNANIS